MGLLIVVTVAPATLYHALLGMFIALAWTALILYDMQKAAAEAEVESRLMEFEDDIGTRVNEFLNHPSRQINDILDRLEVAESALGIASLSPEKRKEKLKAMKGKRVPVKPTSAPGGRWARFRMWVRMTLQRMKFR